METPFAFLAKKFHGDTFPTKRLKEVIRKSQGFFEILWDLRFALVGPSNHSAQIEYPWCNDGGPQLNLDIQQENTPFWLHCHSYDSQ